MKNIILCGFIVISCCKQLKSQEAPKGASLGLDLSYTRLSTFEKPGGFFSLTYMRGKHLVFAGPSLQYYDYAHPQPLWGAQAGYRIFPNGTGRRFNLFFEYNLNYVKGTIKDRVGLYFYEMYAGYADRKIALVSIDNYLGFGFRCHLFKGLYVASNAGFALGFYKEDYSYTDQGGRSWSGKGHLSPRWPLRDNRIFKITVGYDLVRLKKKG